ncbi:beta-N-acetylhexosaminidase [Roseobacter denitrificans]|uniref:beta-N-acetylhexosaminidase n=1 Tax=Roseobacter denitrificans (strain ATCC 33942 / OCh 114) TaxID=375451 RepID=Q164C3_ROSDO|nr:beta-N-acetylhexosaminidase [Roseobacter denitrificans]ABG32670.1 beta-hexosaminidase, putative [Roseobacter denitrificans OCh 114]AVL52101.1 beta-N-acetylhexosaminidase [Roseobacter denitrificans]SFF93509.1 beta-N-acetylhexosaminidase [Roseobacter denitrificans OCh 114]
MARFGATILDAEGLRLTADEKAFFRAANPYGFILFARNIDTPDQVRALCAEMRACVGRDAPITIDQEGGRVQRLRGPVWTEWLPPLDFVARAGSRAKEAMYLRYRLIAAELHDLGIDCNCAPMVDIASADTHEFLRNRCYGTDADSVAMLGRAAADGMLAGGVIPVLKHIPGHGRATLDSHYDLPRVTASAADLHAHDFAPFKALNDLPMGMTAHLVYEALDGAPATLSPKVMQTIREDIGFDNLIMTDDISMKALSGSLPDIAKSALAAGCDVVLHCNGTLAQRHAVADAAGEMRFAAQTRALRALNARIAPDDIDIPAAQAQLETLLNQA